jgi:hypothetical protein
LQNEIDRPYPPTRMRAVFFGGTMPEFERYRSEAEIEEVVRRFESCDYQPEEFFHARHLTVAAWYFLLFDTKTAEERMRAGLRKFIRHHGKNGYHATITEFWLHLVKRTLEDTDLGKALVSRINQVVEALSNKGLINEYYSPERLQTPGAKASWTEPDLKRISGSV